MLIKIQLIIPILNPNKLFFNDIIPRLRSQTIQPNILLINSASEIFEGDYEVITIDKKDFNHANTRNFALNYEADYYLFMTQDAMPYNDALIENLLKPFNHTNVVVSYARQIPYSDADPIERFARQTNYPSKSQIKSMNDLPELGIKTFFSSDSCAMYRGEYFREVGGFTPHLNTNEDMEFAARAILAGKKVAYTADAQVYHSHRFTLHQIWQRYREIGSFFAHNQWLLDTLAQYTKAESTGIKQAIGELKYLARKAPLSLFRSFAISALKFVAFKYSISKHKRE